MSTGRMIQIGLAVCVVGFLLKPVLLPKKVPMMDLEVNTGGHQDMRDLDGKLGLLLYASPIFGDQDHELMDRNVATWKALQDSKKYKVMLVYGASDGDAARAYAKKFDVPVLIDPSKKLGDALKVKALDLAIYREDGKILYEMEDGYIRAPLTSDDVVDAFRK